MTCRDILDFLMDYDAGALTPRERALFDEHLAECPSCTAYLDSYRQTIRMGKALSAEEASQAIPPELVQAILAARGK